MDKKKKIFWIASGVVFFAAALIAFLAKPAVLAVPDADKKLLLGFLRVTVILAVAFTVFFAYLLLFTKTALHKVLALMVFVYGLFYMAVITPISAPDEAHHYQSAYVFSNKLLGWEDITLGYAADFDYTDFKAHNNVASGYVKQLRSMFAPRQESELIKVPGPYGSGYPAKYIFTTLPLTLARLLGLNSFWVYNSARFGNLLLFVFAVFFAVKFAPKWKLVFGVYALLPMSMQQATNCSYDGVINALCLIGSAAVLKCIFEEGKIKAADLLWVFLPLTIQGPVKAIYAFIMLGVFFIPKKRFKNAGVKWGVLIPCVVVCLAFTAAAYFKWPAGPSGPSSDPVYESPRYTQSWISSNVSEAVQIFIRTLTTKSVTWAEQMFGYALSGLSLYIEEWLVLFFGLTLLAALQCNPKSTDHIRPTGGFRALGIALFIIVVLAVTYLMFTGYTNVGKQTIGGVQGRYFLPMLPFLTISLYVHKWRIKKDVGRGIMAVTAALSAWAVIDVLVKTLPLAA